MSPHNGMSSIPVHHGFLGHYQLPAFPFSGCRSPVANQLSPLTWPPTPAPTVSGLYIHLRCAWAGRRCTWNLPFSLCPLTAHPQGLKPGGLDAWTTFISSEFFLFPPSLLFSCCSCLPPSRPCLTGKGCKKPPAPEVEQTGTLEGVSKPLTGLPEL